MSTSFCSDKTIWFHLIVTGDIFDSFFMVLPLQIHKDAASPHLDIVFQQQFFILDQCDFHCCVLTFPMI